MVRLWRPTYNLFIGFMIQRKLMVAMVGIVGMVAGSLDQKVVLITGGAKRVGAATARRLHAAGARLMLHFKSSRQDAEKLQSELNAVRPESVALVQADLLDVAGLPEMVRTTVSQFGRLDALVNNASSFFPTPVGDISVSHWDDLIGTNLKAPLFLSQAAAPHLKKTAGCIVNLTDIHGERPLKNYVVYSVAKAGLIGLTRSLARELGPEVRVNGVSPGPIMWPEDASFDELARQRIVSHTLLKRVGEPDDLARAIYYFIAEAPYVTGQIIAVDGGRSINI
jgi:pteridine reductase